MLLNMRSIHNSLALFPKKKIIRNFVLSVNRLYFTILLGLAMISAIKDFDEDRHESVNMRVGIHTGTVLCGIVGKTRFKFDVWSNDVTLANQMESTGRPGMVHISEKTYGFLKNDYLVEEGDVVGGN